MLDATKDVHMPDQDFEDLYLRDPTDFAFMSTPKV